MSFSYVKKRSKFDLQRTCSYYLLKHPTLFENNFQQKLQATKNTAFTISNTCDRMCSERQPQCSVNQCYGGYTNLNSPEICCHFFFYFFVNFPIRIISVCSRIYPFYVLKNIRFKYKAKAMQELRGDNYEKEIRFLKQLFAQMSEHRKKYS